MRWHEIEDRLEAVVLRQSGGFGRRECEPGWEWSPVADDYDFWLVLTGSGQVAFEGRARQLLAPGTLVFLRPGDRAHFRQNPDDRFTVLYCHFEFIDRVSGEPTIVPAELLPPAVLRVKQIGPLADLLHRIVRRLRDGSVLGRFAVSGMLLEALVHVYLQAAADRGESTGIDVRLQDAVELILERPATRFQLDDVARHVGVSAPQLSAMFVRQRGTTFRRFCVDARLERAKELLRDTVLSVSQVARVLGYSDQFLFSRQFRAKYGEPPSAYRRSVHNATGL